MSRNLLQITQVINYWNGVKPGHSSYSQSLFYLVVEERSGRWEIKKRQCLEFSALDEYIVFIWSIKIEMPREEQGLQEWKC